MDKRSTLLTLLRPHPLGVVLAGGLVLTLQNYCEFIEVVAAGTAYLLLLNSAFNLEKFNPREREVLTTSFLLSFAKTLGRSSPEAAFLRALGAENKLETGLEGSKSRFGSGSKNGSKISSGCILAQVLRRIRDGVPLSESLKQIRGLRGTDALLPGLLSDLISFSSEETSKRICNYVKYRQEKERLKSSLSIKLAVVSLRFKVLTLICSSSLAVIAFASPQIFRRFWGNMLDEMYSHILHDDHSLLHLRPSVSPIDLISEGRDEPKEDRIFLIVMQFGRALFWIMSFTTPMQWRIIVIWSCRNSQDSLPRIMTEWCSGGGSEKTISNVSMEKVLYGVWYDFTFKPKKPPFLEGFAFQ